MEGRGRSPNRKRHPETTGETKQHEDEELGPVKTTKKHIKHFKKDDGTRKARLRREKGAQRVFAFERAAATQAATQSARAVPKMWGFCGSPLTIKFCAARRQ